MQATSAASAGEAEAPDIEAALDRMTAVVRPVGITAVVLDDAPGRISAAAITARLDAPPFAVAAMDGYALRWSDTVASLPCDGVIKAGDRVRTPLTPGTCRRIFTGAPVPPGPTPS